MAELFKTKNGKVACQLCPHECLLEKGRTGNCGVRRSNGSSIELITYGIISGCAFDPVEKKPLYHYYPGTHILSAGSWGCNMKCDFCQNHHISQKVPSEKGKVTSPLALCKMALARKNNTGIAFTYNEPVIWFEYVRDTSVLAREMGLRTVAVSNGYIKEEPLEEMTGFIDAFNIDLKSFANDFYRSLTGARLEPVLNTLKIIAASGRHLEICTLVIPGQNDSEEEMRRQCSWISGELGREIPLHLSGYFPMNKRRDPPTSPELLLRLQLVASEYLDYVYTGNAETERGQDTYCPSCGTIITRRRAYNIAHANVDRSGNCSKCGKQVYRYFSLQ
jgi:pyruvate formate lyase activating enzyme